MKRKHKEIIHIPFVAAPVMIPDAIRPIFSKFAKSRTFPARQVQRAKIILLAADGLDNMQISNQVSLGQDSVSKWRSRFIKKLPLLQEVAEKDPSSLEKAVSAFLNDSPRPGQPMHYTDEQIIKILETACRNPEELGYEEYLCQIHLTQPTAPRSFGPNLPQSGTHIWQKAFFKHALDHLRRIPHGAALPDISAGNNSVCFH